MPRPPCFELLRVIQATLTQRSDFRSHQSPVSGIQRQETACLVVAALHEVTPKKCLGVPGKTPITCKPGDRTCQQGLNNVGATGKRVTWIERR